MKEEKRFFYGWWIVTAGFSLTFAGIGVIINTYGVFFREIIQDMGFSRAGLGMYFTIFSLAIVISAPVLGKLYVKFNIRIVLSLCLTMSGLLFISLSRAAALWHFYLIAAALGVFIAGCSTIPASIMITNWFREKRGTAIGLAFTGSGIGGMVSNPLAQYLIGSYGWRTAYVVLGLLFLLVTLPFALFVIRYHPSEKGFAPLGESAGDLKNSETARGLHTGEVVRSPLFWLLGIAMFLSCLIIMGVQNNIPIFLQDLGHSATFAASMMALYMGVLVAGKITLGTIVDRFGAKAGITFSIAMFLFALVAFINGGNAVFAGIFAMLLAMATPIATVYPSYITGFLFGTIDYGPLYGIQNVFLNLGMAVAMPLTGAAFDIFGSLVPVWYIFMALAAILLILFYFIIGKQPVLERHWHEEKYISH